MESKVELITPRKQKAPVDKNHPIVMQAKALTALVAIPTIGIAFVQPRHYEIIFTVGMVVWFVVMGILAYWHFFKKQ